MLHGKGDDSSAMNGKALPVYGWRMYARYLPSGDHTGSKSYPAEGSGKDKAMPEKNF